MEDYVEGYFKARGWTVKRAKGNTPSYDICITRGRQSFYIEVKHDLASDRTLNYALEFASLEHTKSDFLIIGTPSEAYLLSIEEARNLFNKYPHRQTGDMYDNFSALVPKQVFQMNGYIRL